MTGLPVVVLVVEDGTEYTDALVRFVRGGFAFVRAGSGPEALDESNQRSIDVVFLDMRFDRVDDAVLLGDLAEATERCNGDPIAGRHYLQEHQGTYILAALRAAGCDQPVLLSYDFTDEPRRFERLAARYGPLDFCRDVAAPDEIRTRLWTLAGR